MNTPDKKPGQTRQPGQPKQQGDNHADHQQQGQHPADKGKTHDTTRDPQQNNKETGYPPVNDPTGGPRRDEQRR